MNITTKANGKQERKLSMRERYSEARALSQRMGRLYIMAGQENRGQRMLQCGMVIKAGKCPKCGEIHSIKIDRACYMRLCATCAMRRSRAIAAQGLAAMGWMEENCPPFEPFLVTLTQKNVPEGDLKAEIDRLLEALGKLRKRRAVERQLVGAARTLEVTYNQRTKSWHPHVHLIALLRKEGLDESGLAKTEAWKRIWGELLQLGYSPIIDVRPLHNRDGAVYEVSKYCTKFGKLLDGMNDKRAVGVIKELDEAIYNRALQAWLGAWRQARKALKQTDVDRMAEDKLAETAAQCPDCGGELLGALMYWNGMEYADKYLFEETPIGSQEGRKGKK